MLLSGGCSCWYFLFGCCSSHGGCCLLVAAVVDVREASMEMERLTMEGGDSHFPSGVVGCRMSLGL